MLEKLKEYDSFLNCETKLDGSFVVFRQSPFSRNKYTVFEIQNQFIGSGDWILKKIALMDTQRKDITGNALKNNLKIRNKKTDNRMHKEISDFIHINESILL